jgi:hypothetical protein
MQYPKQALLRRDIRLRNADRGFIRLDGLEVDFALVASDPSI